VIELCGKYDLLLYEITHLLEQLRLLLPLPTIYQEPYLIGDASKLEINGPADGHIVFCLR
jgi:hypothetical protein